MDGGVSMTLSGFESELVDIVVKYSPILGAALAGPAGGMIGRLIATIFNGKTDAQSIITAIKSDPEAELKLKKLEAEHEEELKKLSVKQSALDTLNDIVNMD